MQTQCRDLVQSSRLALDNLNKMKECLEGTVQHVIIVRQSSVAHHYCIFNLFGMSSFIRKILCYYLGRVRHRPLANQQDTSAVSFRQARHKA